MVNVSDKRIATLTQTASQTPQFQPNSDPVQAGLSAVQMGLDFYSKTKAQEELKQIDQAASERRGQISEAAMALINKRASRAAQGATALDLQKADRSILSSYDPETQMEILTMANKASKGSLSQSQSEAKAVRDEREELLYAANDAAAYLGEDLSLDSMTEADLHNVILKGNAKKKAREARDAELATQAAEASNAATARSIDIRRFENSFAGQVGNALSAEWHRMVKNTDLNNTENLNSALNTLSELRIQMPQIIRTTAANSDIPMDSAEVDSVAAPYLKTIDVLEQRLSGGQLATANRNAMVNRSTTLVNTMLTSDNPKERIAGSAILLSSSMEIPLPNKDFSRFVQTSVESAAGVYPDPNTDEGLRYDEQAKHLGSTLKTDQKTLPSDVVNQNTDRVVKLLSADDRVIERHIKNGGVDSIIKGLANGNPNVTLDPERIPEVREKLSRVLERTLSSTLKSFTTQKEKQGAFTVVAKNPNAYDIDPDTFKLTVKPGYGADSRVAANWNVRLDNSIKALKAVGATEKDITKFYEVLSNAVGLTREEMNSGN